MKIYLLMLLIGVIATMSHFDFSSESPQLRQRQRR